MIKLSQFNLRIKLFFKFLIAIPTFLVALINGTGEAMNYQIKKQNKKHR